MIFPLKNSNIVTQSIYAGMPYISMKGNCFNQPAQKLLITFIEVIVNMGSALPMIV